MKEIQNPQVIHPGQIRKHHSNLQRPQLNSNRRMSNLQKPTSAFSYIKAAAKKVAAACTALFSWKRKAVSKDLRSDPNLEVVSFSTDSSGGRNNIASPKLKYSNSYGSPKATGGKLEAVNLSFQEIYRATGNFSSANMIGEGGFGMVYKGRLGNGSLVAIKRAKKEIYDERLSAEFRNEVLTLSKIEHLNLVRLYGYLEHGDERLIIVEYVGNGTLRDHLDGKRGNALEIAERLDIAVDIAHAITYLHMYTDPPIIHRDIKSSNILITEKFRAKVADFGFARLAADPAATHISTQIKGTAGYLDPEYLRSLQLTEKSDVYSFGVLLVELMTGRYPIESKRNIKERVTVRWAMQKLKEGDVVLAMDLRLRRNPASIFVAEKLLKLARQCLAPSRQLRPSMKRCGEVLWEIRKEFGERNIIPAASTSCHSVNVLERDARKNGHVLFGIEDSDHHMFRSA